VDIYQYLNLSKELLQDIDTTRSYATYKIKKSDGKSFRRIDAPAPFLKEIQRTILHKILYLFSAHKIAHGFVKGKSPKTNAEKHLGKKYVIKVDIQDFFPSITVARVESILTYLFEKQKTLFTYANEDLQIFTNVLTLNGCLPQGAPTSPVLSNLICVPMDFALDELQNRYHCTITRYADDITVSADDLSIKEVLNAVKHIILSFGFHVNNRKVKVCKNNHRQKVTGVIVNSKLNAPKETWRNLRATLHQASPGLSAEQHMCYQGNIAWIASLNPYRGRQLQKNLDAIVAKKPINNTSS